MIIQIEGGLFSRLDVLSSIINTKHYPDLIKIVWNPDEGVNAHFHELFENDIEFVNGNHYDDFTHEKYHPGTHLDPRLEASHTKYILADYPILFEDTAKLGIFDACQVNHPFNNLFRQLKPVTVIQKVIDDICFRYKDFHWYGFNIRRGIGLNYHPNSVIYSPTSIFITEAKKILEKHHKNRIVITTDSYEVLEQFCMEFYDKLIFIDDFKHWPINDGYNLAGMERTVIDWFLLTKCRRIYCSCSAGFALRAGRSFRIETNELTSDDLKTVNYYAAAIERKRRGIF